jgi:nucleoside triphosphate diphosphatase
MNKPGDKIQALMRMITLMEHLRHSQHGCAWDRKQSWKTLTRHTLEEVYEVIDAVEKGDPDKICDELGDLLFQVIFYARIAEEGGHFDIGDVAMAIVSKLLHRHPHIFPDGTLESFGESSALTPEQVESNWEQIKNAERRAAENNKSASVMDDIPSALPAMDRAGKLQKRAASVGFDWTSLQDVFACLQSEIIELQDAVASQTQQARQEELGDVLFTCVNLARHLQIDPESALRNANQRFELRFRHMENTAAGIGATLENSTPETLEVWWRKAKEDTR